MSDRTAEVTRVRVFRPSSVLSERGHSEENKQLRQRGKAMSAHFPDAETVRSALTLAVRAPSVHNSQPWLWRVGDHSLHLYANRDLHLSQVDPDSRLVAQLWGVPESLPNRFRRTGLAVQSPPLSQPC